jgi:hypothetical protein
MGVVVIDRVRWKMGKLSNYKFYTIFSLLYNIVEISHLCFLLLSVSESQAFLTLEDKHHLKLPNFQYRCSLRHQEVAGTCELVSLFWSLGFLCAWDWFVSEFEPVSLNKD